MMKTPNTFWLPILVFCLLICAAPPPVHAYVDPGTGAYLLYLLMAVIVGVTYWCRAMIAKIKKLLIGLFTKTPKETDSDPD